MQHPTSQTLLSEVQELARDNPHSLDSASITSAMLDNILVDERICMFRKNGKEYLVAPSAWTMDHDDESPGMGFFTLLYQPGTASKDLSRNSDIEHFEYNCAKIKSDGYSTLELRSLDENNWKPALFVVLGRLVERETADGRTEERTTNYVVLLNLTTNPISVWLVYDYHSLITECEEEFTYFNRLGDYGNWRLHWNDRDLKTRFSPHVQDPLPDDNENEVNRYNLYCFRETCLGIQDQCFCNVGSQGTVDAGPARAKSEDEEILRVKLVECDSCKDVQNEKTSASTDEAKGGESPLRDFKCERGFFGQPHLFDLALLAPDFQTWRPDGLDYAQTMRCLNSTHVRLGSSLRASSVNEDSTLSELMQNHVSIKELCGNGKAG